MHVLISASAGSAWSYGGSILTFVFPMLLFIFVAGALYVAYTMPHMNPGYRRGAERPGLIATPAVRVPGQGGGQRGQTGAGGPRSAAAGTQPAGDAETTGPATAGGPAAGTSGEE